MASFRKKIKTKFTSAKHGRYSLEDSSATPKVLLQKISHHVESDQGQTLYSDSGGLIKSKNEEGVADIPAADPGHVNVQNKTSKEDKFSQDLVWKTNVRRSKSDIRHGTGNSEFYDTEGRDLGSSSGKNEKRDEVSKRSKFGSWKGRRTKTDQNQNKPMESESKPSESSVVWYTQAELDAMGVGDESQTPSSMADVSERPQPASKVKGSTVWFEPVNDSNAVVRTSIDSGYEKSPDPTLDFDVLLPNLALLSEQPNSSTASMAGDSQSEPCLSKEKPDSVVAEIASSAAGTHDSAVQNMDSGNLGGPSSNSSDPTNSQPRKSQEGLECSADMAISRDDVNVTSKTSSNSNLSSVLVSAADRSSFSLAEPRSDIPNSCKDNVKPEPVALTGLPTSTFENLPTDLSSGLKLSDEPPDMPEHCILGQGSLLTATNENVLCSSVATTADTTSAPGHKNRAAVPEDHWGNGPRQMQEVNVKNNTEGNSSTDALENEGSLLTSGDAPSGVTISHGISSRFSASCVDSNSTLLPRGQNELLGASVNSCTDKDLPVSDTGVQNIHTRNDTKYSDSEVSNMDTETADADHEILQENLQEESVRDRVGGEDSGQQIVFSADSEINAIVKNYDNVFFKKTGNKCITLIGDEPVNPDGVRTPPDCETKILNLNGCEVVQLPAKELDECVDYAGQQSDDNNLADSSEEVEKPDGSLESVDKLKISDGIKFAGSVDASCGKGQNIVGDRDAVDGLDGAFSRHDTSAESAEKHNSSMDSQTDVPLIIFEMDEDETIGKARPDVTQRTGTENSSETRRCCCSCHIQTPAKVETNVVKKLVKRSCSDEPMGDFLRSRGFQNIGNGCSSISEPTELNSLGQEGNKSEPMVSNLTNTAATGDSKTGANVGGNTDLNVWNDLSGNLATSTKPFSCPELSVNNLESPPPIVPRRKSNDPLPPLPPTKSLNIPQNDPSVTPQTNALPVPKFRHFACGHQVPIVPPRPERPTGKLRFSSPAALQNETYAMLKDVRVENALHKAGVRTRRAKPAAPPAGVAARRSKSMYCDNRTYVDTCDISSGVNTGCDCDSSRSRYAPSKKTLDDVPPPVPKRNYSLYMHRNQQRVRENRSSSDSESSSSANSLDDLPNLNKKKRAIPNEYIDSDEFPRSPASNEDLRRWEDALSLPTEPDDPVSANLFHIHNSICDMCRSRSQGKKMNSPCKNPTIASGLRPVSSGTLHPLCFNRDEVKFIRTSGLQLDPGTGRPVNPSGIPGNFYDSDSESDSGIGTEITKSRSSSSGEMTRCERYSQSLQKPNAVYARSQKAKSLPQNFANRTYISDAIFHENASKSKPGMNDDSVVDIPSHNPPPVPKRNYSSKHPSMQSVPSNPPPPVPRQVVLNSNNRSFSDEDLMNEPIHMSLQEVLSDSAGDWRHSEDRNNRQEQHRPLSCSPTQNYMRHIQPSVLADTASSSLQKRKSEHTDSSDEGSKDKPPTVPPREKKKNPLSALFKPKQKLGNIFHRKSKDKSSSLKPPQRRLPPLPPPQEQEVILCSEDGDSATSPTDGACGGIESEKEGHNSSNFIDSLIRLREVGWYWGPLNLEDAEAKLASKKDGSFLVRDSSHDSYILSLSFRSQGKTHHTRIEHCHGTFGFWSQPVSHGRMSIIEFIERAMEFSRNGKFLYFLRPHAPGHPPSPVALLYPISRFEVMRSLQHACRFVLLKHVRYDHIEDLPLPQPMKRYLKEKQYFTE